MKLTPMAFRKTYSIALTALLLMSCGKSSNDRSGGGGATDTPGTTDPGGTGTAGSVEFGPFPAEVYTSETADNSCVTFKVFTKSSGAPVGDVGVIFTIVSNSASTAEEKGKVTPESGVTDAAGELEASYCSGLAEGLVTISVKAGAVSANSNQITIKKKPAYTFVYTASDAPQASDAEGKPVNAINLNTIDSGPQDCTMLYFKLLRTGQPVIGATVKFMTQTDFPKGVKLSRRTDALTTELDPVNGKKMASFAGVSSSSGEFAVPICTGSSLGSVSISGTYTDPEEGRRLTASAPVIRITSGITSYINYSLTFDPLNARTLRAFYNTNSEYDLPFSVQTGARADGLSIGDYPVTIATEVGRYTMSNAGYPNPETGAVPVKLHGLHLVDNYPYPVLKFWKNQTAGTVYPLAQTRCEPNEIAAWVRASNGGTALKFRDLKRNWQSTLVYAVRGQEYFHDANRNGVYDAGGMGFWDKNQNGIFDGNDVITSPAGATTFDPSGEWFIDMPTPFVDVDDDLLTTSTGYNPAIDILLGDEYIAPNGKRDADTMIWKSEVFPISMGPSGFSLTNNEIRDDGTGKLNPIPEMFAQNSLVTVQDDIRVLGRGPLIASKMWDSAPQIGPGVFNFVFFAQDLCGNLLPGGTKLSVNFEEIYKPVYGTRTNTAFLYPPPGDDKLEPTRQLLREIQGSTAKINFNSSNHPSAVDSYPIYGSVEVPSCNTECTGYIATGGVACDAWTGYVRLDVEDPDPNLDQHSNITTLRVAMTVPAVRSCTCSTALGVYFHEGECKCPTGTALDTTLPTPACVAQ